MPNLYISNILPPYRVDLCNEFHERLGCEICHFSEVLGDNCFSVKDLYSRARFVNRIVPTRIVGGKYLLENPESLIAEDTRLVFVNEFSPVALQMLRLRQKYGFRVVSFCDDSMDMIRGNDVGRLHKVARRFVPRWMDEIILPSPEVASWYVERYGKGLAMPIIADEVLMRKRLIDAVPVSDSFRREYSLDERKIVLYVGRLVGVKNLSSFLEAFRAVSNRARLVITGDGVERPALERLSASLGLDVIFTGARYGTELLAWYNIADVLVLPSTRESFGAVTGEALTCGCRVLLSSLAGSTSLLRDGENGQLIDPCSLASMESGLVKLLDMPDLPRDSSGIRPCLLPVSFKQSVEDLISHIALSGDNLPDGHEED